MKKTKKPTPLDRFVHGKILAFKRISPGDIILKYSSNPRFFLPLQERMAGWGFCCTKIDCDYTYRYKVTFIHSSNHDISYSVEDDTLMLAFCRAAQKAWQKVRPDLRKGPMYEE